MPVRKRTTIWLGDTDLEPGDTGEPARRRPSSGSSARGSVTDDRLF